MNNKCFYIPHHINKDYVLIWNRDEVVFLMLPWLLFFVVGGILGLVLTLVCTIIVAQMIKKISIDKPGGYMLHWVKYNIPKQFVSATFSKGYDLEVKKSLLFRSETFPPTHIRHIAG